MSSPAVIEQHARRAARKCTSFVGAISAALTNRALDRSAFDSRQRPSVGPFVEVGVSDDDS